MMVLREIGLLNMSKERFEIIMTAISAFNLITDGGASAGWALQRDKTKLISDFQRKAFNISKRIIINTCL